MKTSRRDVLKLAVAGGAVVGAGCARLAQSLPGDDLPASLALPQADVHPVTRLLNRAAFGPRPGQVAEVESIGIDAWLDQQLQADQAESPMLAVQLSRLDVWQEDPEDLVDLTQSELIRQLNQADLLHATYSQNQVLRRMVDLWQDHFNIYALKGRGANRIGRVDYEVLAKDALTTFPQLLKAVAHSPAMLAYLDNQLNVKGTANENYARELMELHTLGVHGGYTQKDVEEVARCLTGWTFERRFLHRKGTFRFDPDLHDDGQKIVLGHVIPAGGGESDGETVLNILAAHPATASFIAGKFCRYFLGDMDHPMRPQLAAVYQKTGGDIKSMLRPLFTSNALLNGPSIAKRPFDFVVGALRVTAARSDCGGPVQDHLRDMGQPLYEWPMPDGYPDRAAAWTGSLLARWNFAAALAAGGVSGTSIDLNELKERSRQPTLLAAYTDVFLARNRPAPDDDRLKQVAGDQARMAALVLSSPEFQLR